MEDVKGNLNVPLGTFWRSPLSPRRAPLISQIIPHLKTSLPSPPPPPKKEKSVRVRTHAHIHTYVLYGCFRLECESPECLLFLLVVLAHVHRVHNCQWVLVGVCVSGNACVCTKVCVCRGDACVRACVCYLIRLPVAECSGTHTIYTDVAVENIIVIDMRYTGPNFDDFINNWYLTRARIRKDASQCTCQNFQVHVILSTLRYIETYLTLRVNEILRSK